ncbi:N-acetyltransferase [Schizosaccharomyces cryophilus OY26]|uniref:N-acetyltransferase n=1 Tax=Schizosaccharomyces cryophilus (strain OY26 / ATCC MYA-4695 / CBS 11777 / NBRC 106824 / NRRL Y48691) TaxID=653667 RepID=S9W0Q6_SCHCR|nr:N-acetyltransferase [Schizosaccharomyces cryophilus OY26]EPY51999.1 N-acetyltransferase [Schizosaccharomyces cryophilus OY26]
MIELDTINPNNLKVLEVINQNTIPEGVRSFSPQYYKETVQVGSLAQYAYFNNVCVGAVRCKKETHNKSSKVQILSLGVLPAYRKYGAGTKLLEHAVNTAKDIGSKEIYVQLPQKLNAKDWFLRRGFTELSESSNEDTAVLNHPLY